MKPTPELPARASLGDGLLREALDVVDIAVGGMALSSPALRGTTVGQELTLDLTLAGETHVVKVVARWSNGEVVGVELSEPPLSTSQAIGRYVAELLERGGSA